MHDNFGGLADAFTPVDNCRQRIATRGFPMAQAPNQLDAIEALAAMAAGRLTAEALARACLDRIAARDGVVRAFAYLDAARALAEARLRDRAGPRGSLHGLPFGVKDIIDTHDMPTHYGSPIHAGHQPSADAACVALAREAGAVMLGKTVTTEFALRHPGPTANPHNPAHTPGGSSSGSAAAVADFMVPVAFGTQTGGSIIRPASYCGVIGYKPSIDTINPTGVKPLAGSFDTVGLFARSVDDCALVVGVLAGDDRGAAPLEAVRPTRVGLWRTPAWHQAEPATVRAVETAARQLARQDVVVDEIELPAEFELFLDAQSDVLRFEAARVFAFERTRHADLLSPSSRDELEAGAAIPRHRYREARALLARCRLLFAAAIAPFDLLLSASAQGEAPAGLANTGEATFNRWCSGLHVPCLNLPGFTGPNGLPVGVQVIGAIDDDARLLRAAKWIAAHVGDAVSKE
jgi:Asp-tRNA(Asn)/Glu-tRNA(Gln) amidotransferase A subunit family amidase